MPVPAAPRRPIVVYADGPDGPLPVPASLAAVRDLDDHAVVLGWTLRTPGWLADLPRPAVTFMAGYGLRRPATEGLVRAVPTRISSVPGLLAGRLRPAVAVVGARPAGSGFRCVTSAGWAPIAARHADAVVVEVWADAPAVDAPLVSGNIVEIVERDAPPDAPPRPERPGEGLRPELGEVERRIGSLVANLVPAGATVQWGPGTIGAAVVEALDVRVRVLSGLVTDEVVGLARRGLLDGPAEAAYLWGGDALRRFAADGGVRLRSIAETHDPTRLAAVERYVTLNTALEVGLDGAVNVELAGGGTAVRAAGSGAVVAGPGGHADYCEAATRSAGGLSVVALRATHAGRSSIVARPSVVTTSRADVGVVVTEHGVADLRDVEPAERARRLVAVAAPEHREALAKAAAGA